MGMFDDLVPFTEHFNEGELFTLLDAKLGNEIETEYGDGTPVLLRIKTDENPSGEWYSLFGKAIENQVNRMDPGELRGGVECAVVRHTNKAGRNEYKVLATKAQIEAGAVPDPA